MDEEPPMVCKTRVNGVHGGKKQSVTSDQNEEILDGKPPGKGTSTVTDQSPRDDSKKRRRSQDCTEPSYPPVTPSKRERVYDSRTGIEGNTK
ncbi:hypothetical protein SUGI_0709340 [Cryptomeria japonica]|nr:hypothetical protein SUGI_0709340 [Cryptomeria japonica]